MEQKFLLENLKAFMSESKFQWAVCGGFALDLFLDRNIRTHGDMDLCAFETDREAIKDYILGKGWHVYEFRGQGKVRPLEYGMAGDTGRNLMCVREDCQLVKFYPCQEAGMLYHRFFHTGLKAFSYLEFLFSSVCDGDLVLDQRSGIRRELTKAFLQRNGISYLAPEIALLYKASDCENPAYQLDFHETYPCLNDEQRIWFQNGMRLLYPDGHPWLVRSDVPGEHPGF